MDEIEYKRASEVHAILLKDMDNWKSLLLVIEVNLINGFTLYVQKKTLTIVLDQHIT